MIDQQLVVREPGILRPLVKPDQLIEAQNEVTQLIVKALKRGTDYGQVPGTKGKETLFKPGAERLQKAFGCHTRFDVIEKEIDHDRRIEWSKLSWNYNTRRKEEMTGTSLGLYRYVILATVIGPHGQPVGSGLGSCSTLENKYIDRPRDLENTVLKMSQKRAKVAATLDAFGLSDRFTQDLDDQHEEKEEQSEDGGAPQEQAAAGGDGYDPQNRQHQNWLLKELKAKKIPEDRWDDVGNALKGKPASQFQKVLTQVIGA